MATIGDQVRALPGSGINQTSFLFGAILFAYLFFVTVRGDLPKWLGILGLAGTSGTTTLPASTPTGSNGNAGISGLPTLPALPSVGMP